MGCGPPAPAMEEPPPTSRARAPSQRDLDVLCTTLEEQGRDALLTLLGNSGIKSTSEHPRARTELATHLAKRGCAFVNTQKDRAALRVSRDRGDVTSFVPAAVLQGGTAATLAFGCVIALVGGTLVLMCAGITVYAASRWNICHEFDWLLEDALGSRRRKKRSQARTPLKGLAPCKGAKVGVRPLGTKASASEADSEDEF